MKINKEILKECYKNETTGCGRRIFDGSQCKFTLEFEMIE